VPTRFFSGSIEDVLLDTERYRELRGFCSHDLRSQIGAVSGLLELLEDQLKGIDTNTKSSFRAALTSAQEALTDLDQNLVDAKPTFEIVWLIGFTPEELQQMQFSEALLHRKLALPKPVLFLSFDDPDEWHSRVRKYRPIGVFFKDRDALGIDAISWINRLGPQLTEIVFLDGARGPLAGIRPEVLTLLNAPADLAQIPQQIFETIAGFPRG
jgi:hypothetical protein